MTRNINYINILQFDEHLISRLRVHRSNKGIEAVAFDQERGEWSTQDGSLGAALKAFAAQHRLSEELVYTVLPRHDMTTRILDLPSQDPAEIDGMVRLSAEEYVPFSVDELMTDQCILRKKEDGESRVLAVFAHRDVVETHIKLLHGAKIDPRQIFLSTACLASAAITAVGPTPQPYAVVNLASGGLEILVIKDQTLAYGRAIASQQDWSRKESADGPGFQDMMEELIVEVRASLSAYRRESEDGGDVEAICLCSDVTDVTGHCETLFHELGLECAPAAFARDLTTQGADLLPVLPLTALGAALIVQERAPVAIQLLPESMLRTRERAGVQKLAIRVGALAAAILVGLIGLYAEAVYQRKAYVRELNAHVAKIEPRAKGIVSKQRQLSILQRQVERTGSVIELLASLCDLFPDADMNITRFSFTHNDKIEVFGRAKSLASIEKLVQDLNQAGKSSLPQFARAQQIYEQKTSERGQEVLDYKISLPFPRSTGAASDSEEVASE